MSNGPLAKQAAEKMLESGLIRMVDQAHTADINAFIYAPVFAVVREMRDAIDAATDALDAGIDVHTDKAIVACIKPLYAAYASANKVLGEGEGEGEEQTK